MMLGGVPPADRRRRLGQHFLADPNLLDAIVREAALDPADVVLEIGGGEGALTERVAPLVRVVHVIEIDERLRDALGRIRAAHTNVTIHWGDAVRFDLGRLDPAPTAMVANLPYAVATPLILRTIAELPKIQSWTVMVQREIADRLRARSGGREYGAVSVIAQLACRVEMLRTVDRAVFVPRPRVDSAVVRLTRRGPAPSERVRQVVRAAFAHRRKRLARSLELALAGEPGVRDRARDALARLGLDPGARAQELEPAQFVDLAGSLGGEDG
jgi:16S rRNA (adenine1518-N6/adenine1519-N6)-dimethyltransferase